MNVTNLVGDGFQRRWRDNAIRSLRNQFLTTHCIDKGGLAEARGAYCPVQHHLAISHAATV